MYKFTWLQITLLIAVFIVLNKLVVMFYPLPDSPEFRTAWFAGQFTKVSIRMMLTLILVFFFFGYTRIIGWKKLYWSMLLLIPLVWYLVGPGVVDYPEILNEPLIWTAITTILIGVCQEEIFSRGIVYTHLKEKLNGSFSILLSSIIFGLLHVPLSDFTQLNIGNIAVGTLAPAILGVVLCTVYHFFKSLPLVVILHFIWNFTTFLWNESNIWGH